ncbi:MAG: hypothetical protein FWD18_08905 [Micrococcales bacterium]|nr:hypothetical protein [Micrococcales bacterium]
MATKKNVVRVSDGEGSTSSATSAPTWAPTPEAKGRALRLRLFAAGLWAVAIGAEAVAIFWALRQDAPNIGILIGLIAVAAAGAITGSLLWKKANRLDPASREDTIRFFVQNQLGLIIAIIAFLPLIVMVFLNKDLDGKQKGIVGGIAIIALAAAGFAGVDPNPPSIEEYAEQTQEVEALTGSNHVYWTVSGSRYHLYDDCNHINSERTVEIFEGTVAQARELKNITELCKTCRDRWLRENPAAVKPEDTEPQEPGDGDDGPADD